MVGLIIHQNINRRNVTQYLIREVLDVIGKVTLLADVEIPSLVKPPDGVWLRVHYGRQAQPLHDIC